MSDPVRPDAAHPWREHLETIAIAITMALILKYFTLEAFQIPTGSMQPTLMGLDGRATSIVNGRPESKVSQVFDRILVDKLIPFFRAPRRFEIWVFLYPLDKSSRYIKRVVGMPGEELKIEFGDIKVRKSAKEEFRPARKPREIQESMWLRVWDADNDDFAGQFWDMSGCEITKNKITASAKASFRNKKPVLDRYEDGYPGTIKPFLSSSSHEPCNARVRDMRLRFDASPAAEHRQIVMKLGWGGDVVRAEIAGPAGDGRTRLFFNDRELASKDIRLQFNQSNTIEFSRADEAAEIVINGEVVARGEFESAPVPSDNNTVSFESDGGSLALEDLSLDRDVYYTNMNGFQTTTIPEGHYFMLGDNSTFSADGRAWMERTIELREPIDGVSKLTGGTRTSGATSDWNPRRFSVPGLPTTQIFRDEFGEEYRFNESARQVDHSRQFVPADHFIGRALFVFFPWPPKAPIVRFGFVR